MATRVVSVTLDKDGTVTDSQSAEVLPEEANRNTLEGRAAQALAANKTYLALGSPTNAQNLAQIRLLTQECSALIRILLNRFEATD